MTNPNLTEEWRPVPGWKGLYSVSNTGSVRIEVRRRKLRPGQALKLPTQRDGYRQAILSRDGTKETTIRIMVHRLVAEAFIGPISAGHVVNHLDGDKRNNCLPNLEVCTHRENISHSMRVLGNRRDGEHNPAAKLTEADVLGIRERAAKGETRASIAKTYNISDVMVGNIALRRSWTKTAGPRSTTPKSNRLTPDQREEAVRRVLAGEAKVGEVARELGVDHAAICYHVKKAKKAAKQTR